MVSIVQVNVFIDLDHTLMPIQRFINLWSLASGSQKRQPGPYTHAHSMLHQFMVTIVLNPGAREFIKPPDVDILRKMIPQDDPDDPPG